jgi:hypothetical protein
MWKLFCGEYKYAGRFQVEAGLEHGISCVKLFFWTLSIV